MKKIFCLVISLLMILSLFSCSKNDEIKNTADEFKNAVDISKLNGTELYEYSLQQKKSTAGAKLKITESLSANGTESSTEFSVYADMDKRDESYYYQACAEKGICYFEGKLYIKEGSYGFSSDMPLSDFYEYFEQNIGDKWYFGKGFEKIERNENTLEFSGIGDKNYLSMISGIAGDKITEAKAKAELSEDQLIKLAETEISADGIKFSSRIELLESGDGTVKAAMPEGNFSEVTDLRAPMLIASAVQNLLSANKYSVTVNSSDTLSLSGLSSESHKAIEINYRSEQNAYSFNIDESEYNKNTSGGKAFTEIQYYGDQSKYQTRIDDLIEKKISSESLEETSDSIKFLKDYLMSAIPVVTDFEKITMTESTDKYMLEFSLKKEKIDAKVQNSIAKLISIDSAISPSGEMVSQNLTGTCSIYKNSGILEGVSFSISTKYQNSVQSEILYSMMFDTNSDVSVSPIAEPDYNAIDG